MERFLDNADAYEVVWSLIAWGSFLVALFFANDSRRDMYVQRLAGGNRSSIALSKSNMVNALSKSIAFALYGFLGLYLMGTPPPDGELTPKALGIRMILIVGQLTLLLGMTYTQVVRKQVLIHEAQDAQERIKEAADIAAAHLAANTEAIKDATNAVHDLADGIRTENGTREGEQNDALG